MHRVGASAHRRGDGRLIARPGRRHSSRHVSTGLSSNPLRQGYDSLRHLADQQNATEIRGACTGDGARPQPPIRLMAPTTRGALMTLVLAVAGGGAFGAVSRYGVDTFIEQRTESVFPSATLLINVSGCLAVGFIIAALVDRHDAPRWLRAALVVGFCGGYTTFFDLRAGNARPPGGGPRLERLHDGRGQRRPRPCRGLGRRSPRPAGLSETRRCLSTARTSAPAVHRLPVNGGRPIDDGDRTELGCARAGQPPSR